MTIFKIQYCGKELLFFSDNEKHNRESFLKTIKTIIREFRLVDAAGEEAFDEFPVDRVFDKSKFINKMSEHRFYEIHMDPYCIVFNNNIGNTLSEDFK